MWIIENANCLRASGQWKSLLLLHAPCHTSVFPAIPRLIERLRRMMIRIYERSLAYNNNCTVVSVRYVRHNRFYAVHSIHFFTTGFKHTRRPSKPATRPAAGQKEKIRGRPKKAPRQSTVINPSGPEPRVSETVRRKRPRVRRGIADET